MFDLPARVGHGSPPVWGGGVDSVRTFAISPSPQWKIWVPGDHRFAAVTVSGKAMAMTMTMALLEGCSFVRLCVDRGRPTMDLDLDEVCTVVVVAVVVVVAMGVSSPVLDQSVLHDVMYSSYLTTTTTTTARR